MPKRKKKPSSDEITKVTSASTGKKQQTEVLSDTATTSTSTTSTTDDAQQGTSLSVKASRKRTRFTSAQVRELLLDSESEDINDDYTADDFESEYSDDDTTDVTAPVDLPAPSNTSVADGTWTSNTSFYSAVDAEFNPFENVGPKNIPNSITAESKPMDFLSLFWDDSVWTLIVTETNRQALYVKKAKPNSYCAKSFEPVTVQEMKAFFGCRLAMEMLIYKDR